jgi:taurine dioxygenase
VRAGGAPELCFRLSWQPGTLTVWDNRCTRIYAVNDYHGERRVMHRVIVTGERPE